MSEDHEALIVGGGAAGLSAALVLGRARVRTLLVDAGEPSNRFAPAIGGLLGQHDAAPDSLYSVGRAQLAELPSVTVVDGTVTDLANGFTATLDDGQKVGARRVLLATGMHYRYPDIPGIEALWGDTAFHCPYCHGWEHRDGALALLGNTAAAQRARLLRAWTDDVVVIADDVTAEDRAALAEAGIPLDERTVAALESSGDRLTGVRLADGEIIERDAVMVFAPLSPRDDLGPRLGCETVDRPNAKGILVTDDQRRTTVPGVFAAGDVADRLQQVAVAIAAGSEAAAFLHHSLLFD